MPSLKASEPGVAKIKQARNEKGWTVEDERWLIRASQVLEPDKTWPMENQEGKNCYFPGISLTTWKRFLQGKRSINTEVFKAFCQVLGLDWEEIRDRSSKEPEAQTEFFVDDAAWVGRETLIEDLSDQIRESCRILILTGITGIGKTALAERLALELQADLSEWVKLNFEDGTPRDFTGFADTVLTRLKEEVTPDDRKNPDSLLNRLVQKLRNNCYLVQIDSIEVLLKGKADYVARNEFQYEGWWEFFNRLLAGQDCKSRLILTSQDLPTQFYGCKSKHWAEKPLKGLEKAEQLELFQKLFQQEEKAIEPEAAGYLKQIGEVYEGHPLVIEVIAGEILAHPFNGNVVAYWQRYSHEFEAIVPATDSQILELRVKDRVRDSLTRLKQDVSAAYTLLCRSSVYRRPVPESFWLAMLEGRTQTEKATALKTLEFRRLIEEVVTATGQFLLCQHNLVRSVAYELLGETDKEEAHTSAANIWRTAYEPEVDATNLEQVRGYLETFHHLCEVEAWEEGGKILFTRLNIPKNYKLHNQLSTWGYYRERIYLYDKLLGKFSSKLNIIFLNGLGDSYQALGNYTTAIEYHKQALVLTLENKQLRVGWSALNSLGNAYLCLGNYAKAVDHYQLSLAIAREIRDRQGEASILGNLGNACRSLGKYHKAIDYHQQSLTIARETRDRQVEGTALGGLGFTYRVMGHNGIAIKYFQQHLDIARETQDRREEENALGNLGVTYRALGYYHKAIDYYRRCLTIAREIQDQYGESIGLTNLGNAYALLGEYSTAIEYQQQSLVIAQKIGNREGEGNTLGSLGTAYASRGDYATALEYQQQHLLVMRDIQDRQGEGKALCNLGVTRLRLKQYVPALKDLQVALEIFIEIKNPSEEERTLINLGIICCALGDYEKAISYNQQHLAIVEETLEQMMRAHSY